MHFKLRPIIILLLTITNRPLSKKYLAALKLGNTINHLGFKIMPYLFYYSQGLYYIALPKKSNHYSKYAYHRYLYNASRNISGAYIYFLIIPLGFLTYF